jgi:hypothetical protein
MYKVVNAETIKRCDIIDAPAENFKPLLYAAMMMDTHTSSWDIPATNIRLCTLNLTLMSSSKLAIEFQVLMLQILKSNVL